MKTKILSRVYGHAFVTLGLFLTLGLQAHAQVGSVENLVYQGRIANDGTPLNAGVTTFEVSIFGGAANCLLFKETFSKDMANSAGHYSFSIGSGTRVDALFGGGAPTHSLSDALRNIGTINSLNCGGSSGSFSPALSNDRRFQLRFNPAGTGWVSLPSQAIKSTPYAMQAMQVNGYGISNLAKISGTGASSVMSPAGWAKVIDYSELGNLVLGAGGAVTCDGSRAGGMRYNAGAVEFCNGTAWTALSSGGSAISALTGDIAASGTGSVSATINAGAVTSTKILDGTIATADVADSAITAVKLNQMSATSGQVLKWNGTAWAPANDDNNATPSDASYAAKGIVQFQTDAATSGLTVAAGVARLANSGVTAGSYGSATQVPAITVDAFGRVTAVTATTIALPASAISSGTLSITQGGTGASSLTANRMVMVNGLGTVLTNDSCTTGQVLRYNGTLWACVADTSLGAANAVVNNGNSFAGTMTVGTNDNNELRFETNGTDKMTVLANGNVGVGTTSPAASSIMELSSTTKGVLIPRMTTAQRDAIATPATGLQVYNTTTNALNFYNGTSWQALGISGAGISSLTAGTGLTGGTITTSGTIAVDVGTGNNQIVQLNGSAQLPAVSGVNLTNLNATNLASGTVAAARLPAFTGDATSSAGTSALTIANDAVTYAKMQNVSATSRLLGRFSAGAGDTEELSLGASLNLSGGGVLSLANSGVTAGTYGSATQVPTITVDALGRVTAATATAIALPASAITSGILDMARGGTGVTSLTANRMVMVNGTATALLSDACTVNQVLQYNGTTWACVAGSSLGAASAVVNNGNSFASTMTLGTNDNNELRFETNGTDKMTVLANGNVGIGVTSPSTRLHVSGDFTASNAWLNQVATPTVLGGTAPSQNLTLESTNNGTKGFVNIQPNGGNVGIGTTAPASSLHVDNGFITTGRYGSVGTLLMRSAAGTQGSPTAISAADSWLSYITGRGYDGTTYQEVGSINMKSDGAISSTSSPGYITFQTTPVSTIATVERMRITSAGNVGIGTTNPGARLVVSNNSLASLPAAAANTVARFVAADGSNSRLSIEAFGTGSSTGVPSVSYRRANGTAAAPSALISGDIIGNMNFLGHGATGFTLSRAAVSGLATENWTDTANGTQLTFATTPNGSATTQLRMTIDHNGNVGIGIPSPDATLAVNGTIRSVATSNAGTTIDFSTGNLQFTSASCGAITLNQLKSGAVYNLAVQGTAGGTCAFTAWSGTGTGALTIKAGPTSLVQTANKDVVFSFMVMGSTVYVTSIDGF